MKVRAKKLGYYDNKRRREGEVFELKPVKGKKKKAERNIGDLVLTPEQQFSDLWMERVDGEAPVKKEEPKVEEPDSSSEDEVI